MKNNGKLHLGGESTVSMSSMDDSKKEILNSAVELQNEAIASRKKEIDEEMRLKKELADELKSDLSKLGIKPYGSYILVKPYKINPYETVEVNDAGITVNTHSGLMYNEESGELEKAKRNGAIGLVVDVNLDCDDIKPGDDVFYRTHQSVDIQFMRQGLEVVSVHSIQAVVGPNLDSRWDEIKKEKEKLETLKK